MVITIILFIVVLGLLVYVHELGHFIAAKKSGMQVEEFGFGFPPRLLGAYRQSGKWRLVYGRKKIAPEHTVYSLNAIPLGGFVKITGENLEQETAANPKSFQNRPAIARFITLAAGVIMNFLLAWVITAAGFIVGIPQAVTDSPAAGTRIEQRKILIGMVGQDTPASKAGLMAGDVLLTVDGRSFASAALLKDYITSQATKPLQFVVTRPGHGDISLTVESDSGNEHRGPTGVGPVDFGILKADFAKVPLLATKDVIGQVQALYYGIKMVFSSGNVIQNLGGPIEIANQTGIAARMGLPFLLQFTSFLSVNLAVLNSLPIPALDGGRILFLIIEKVRKKRSVWLEQWANTVGFLALLLLMLVVTVKDLLRYL